MQRLNFMYRDFETDGAEVGNKGITYDFSKDRKLFRQEPI